MLVAVYEVPVPVRRLPTSTGLTIAVKNKNREVLCDEHL